MLLHYIQGLSGRLHMPACRLLALPHMALDRQMSAPKGCRAAAGLPADEEHALCPPINHTECSDQLINADEEDGEGAHDVLGQRLKQNAMEVSAGLLCKSTWGAQMVAPDGSLMTPYTHGV